MHRVHFQSSDQHCLVLEFGLYFVSVLSCRETWRDSFQIWTSNTPVSHPIKPGHIRGDPPHALSIGTLKADRLSNLLWRDPIIEIKGLEVDGTQRHRVHWVHDVSGRKSIVLVLVPSSEKTPLQRVDKFQLLALSVLKWWFADFSVCSSGGNSTRKNSCIISYNWWCCRSLALKWCH